MLIEADSRVSSIEKRVSAADSTGKTNGAKIKNGCLLIEKLIKKAPHRNT
jgi:hypothetical protein